MATHVLLDGRACSLDDEGVEAASLLTFIEACDDKHAIQEAEGLFPEQGWALFRGCDEMEPIACSNENGTYWRADEEGGT